MGWFWADTAAAHPPPSPPGPVVQKPSSCPLPHRGRRPAPPPPRCPMHQQTVDALASTTSLVSTATPPSSWPPIQHAQTPPADASAHPSLLSKINPLNYMFRDLSQAPAPNQTCALPIARDPSSIPKGSGDGNWEYPSPQQMYNALLRKGYTDTDATAVESMVAVHNFLNEGAWAEIVEWEARFGHGLSRAWHICKRGEENAHETQRLFDWKHGCAPVNPTLVRFHGRPQDMTPKAAMFQLIGRVYPAKFGTEPPFDRHDWYVSRDLGGKQKLVRYVIDYYGGPPEPTGEPVFFLDVRPAMTPLGAIERVMRWGGDVWWKASGAESREASHTSGQFQVK